MIVKKRWIATEDKGDTSWVKEGYFLLGVLPIYIYDLSTRIKWHSTRVG